MSAQTLSKKRKSADGNTVAVKKVKTTKPAAQPAPLKSALKKSKATTTTAVDKNDVVEDAEQDVSPVTDADASKPTLTPSQTAALLAGFSSDSESDTNEPGLDISTLPVPPKSKSSKPSASDPETTPGVLYIGRIPHGFHEPQMRSYFSQFGTILNLRLLRNRRTGRSQHVAFIEFASSAVADIVRRTMDKYLLFGRILQVKSVPREQVGEGIWKSGKRGGRNVAPRNRIEGRRLRDGASREVWEGRVEREERKRKGKMEKLGEMGYEFEMPGLKTVDDIPAKTKVAEDAGHEEADIAGASVDEETTTVEQIGDEVVKELKKTKKRPATGKTELKKVVKKVKA